jgi:hypothetical protein
MVFEKIETIIVAQLGIEEQKIKTVEYTVKYVEEYAC